MKVGAENRSKLIAAIALSALAVVLVVRFLAPSKGAPGTPAQAAGIAKPAPAARAARQVAGRKKVDTTPRSLDPSLRYDWLKASEDTKYEGTGRNIFLAQAEIPKPEGPGVTDKNGAPSAPTGLPPPPPITLKFFGFASKPGEPKKVFLSEGEDVFIAAEGDIVDRRYRVLRIGPSSVEVEDVLNNNRQSIPLTQG